MEGYYEAIRDPSSKGAVFFAVCRGKVLLAAIDILYSIAPNFLSLQLLLPGLIM